MPTYEYECKKCENRFDAFQSMSDDPLKTCPECGGRVKRLIGAGAGIIFKGSGFYVTDSRKGSSSSSSTQKSESAKDSSSAGSSSDSTSDSSTKSGENGGKKSDTPKSDGKKSESSSSAKGKKD
jgi:putative FmdB family regulatory protein